MKDRQVQGLLPNKETKETQQPNAIRGPTLDPVVERKNKHF